MAACPDPQLVGRHRPGGQPGLMGPQGPLEGCRGAGHC